MLEPFPDEIGEIPWRFSQLGFVSAGEFNGGKRTTRQGDVRMWGTTRACDRPSLRFPLRPLYVCGILIRTPSLAEHTEDFRFWLHIYGQDGRQAPKISASMRGAGKLALMAPGMSA